MMRHFFYSLATTTVALFFILIGIGCLTVPWSAEVRYFLVRLILEDGVAISIFGMALILVGIGMSVYQYLRYRRKAIVIRCGNHLTTVEHEVINRYISAYWKQHFPDADITSLVLRKQGKIAIEVDLPSTPIEEQKELLNKIENDLKHILTTKIGYENDFYLTACFASS